MTAGAAGPKAGASRAALFAVCLAGFAFSANYTNHAPMAPALIAEFHFSQALAGLLTTGIFLTHALMQVPGGHIVDRLGPVRVMIAGLLVVAAGNFGIATASSYAQLLAWKVFTGLGTGASIVAGARYITSSYSGHTLHVAQGFYGGSILLGSGFVIFAVPQLLAAFGWRGAFMSTAALAILGLLVYIVIVRPPARTSHAAGSFAGMLAHPQLWLLGVVQMASFGLVIVIGAWISALLRTSLGMQPKSAGLLGSLVLLLGIATRPLGGYLAPRLGIKHVLQCSMLLNIAGCAVGWLAHSLPVTAIAILLLGTGCGLPYAGLFNTAASLFPGRAGAAMGLVNTIGIVMILAGAPAIGRLADLTGEFRTSFVALGAFCIVALAAASRIRSA